MLAPKVSPAAFWAPIRPTTDIVLYDVMLEILFLVGLVSVATLFGSMAFFSGVIAPLIFTNLDEATAGRFVRSIFPWYYLVIVGLSLLATATLSAIHPLEAAVMGIIAFGAVFARQFLMPRINDYRDRMVEGDKKAEKTFAGLHRLSVWINGGQLVGALTVLVLMGMAYF